MEINLSPELESFITAQVASGAFDSPEEVLAAGLKALQADPLAEVKADIQEGYRQALNGEFYEGTVDDIKREARARFEAEQKAE